MTHNILLVCGTRPEIIKMAPVHQALLRSTCLTPTVLHSGQHTELAEPMYAFFNMQPDLRLHLQRRDTSLPALSAALLDGLGSAIPAARPAAVLVQGDTSTAAMAALAAFYAHIPVGHVEAGLRTGDIHAPFPEEMNRQLIARIARWHYAPTARAAHALHHEGIDAASVLTTGNTGIDAALHTAELLRNQPPPVELQQLDLVARLKGRRLALVTAHRRENWGEGIASIAAGVAELLDQQQDLFVLWAMHANPAVSDTVRNAFSTRSAGADRLVLSPHLSYPSLIWLLAHAWLAMTDSGGIQEEAASLGVPVLILRERTERAELVEAGGGIVVGADATRLLQAAQSLHRHPERHRQMRQIANPFGDGHAAERIVRSLESHFG